MNLHRASAVTLELWVTPGEEQTLEDLLGLFEGRVLEVRGDMVLVGHLTQEVSPSQA